MPDRRPQVVVDSSAWIALLAGEAGRADHVLRLLEHAEADEVRILVSTITITEVVKGPAAADPPLTDEQERIFVDFMDNPYLTLVSVDPLVAARARDLRRAVRGLKTPDALIVATAIVAGAETLYTYDGALLGLDGDPVVGGLQIGEPPVEARQLPLALPDGAKSAPVDDDEDLGL
jgi:predicted nucleic acid-binding protein